MRTAVVHACLVALGVAGAGTGCAGKAPPRNDAGEDASADPAIGHLAPIGLSSAKLPASGAAPSIENTSAAPTTDEAAQTPMPRFVAIVPNPSPKSKLPCPTGTVLSVLDTSVRCRLLSPKSAFKSSEGPALAFHRNGKLRSQGQYADGESTGHWWFFREEGALDYEVDYVAGEYDGLYVSYWPNAARHVEHHEKRGKLDGVAKSWDEQGKLSSWALYEGGRLVRRKSFR
jgi:hypothetical protein